MRWRRMMMRRLLPALRAFRPSLIMVSAGFDGAAFDVGNIKLDSAERGKWEHGIDLRPEDFEWFTRQVRCVNHTSCVYTFNLTNERDAHTLSSSSSSRLVRLVYLLHTPPRTAPEGCIYYMQRTRRLRAGGRLRRASHAGRSLFECVLR